MTNNNDVPEEDLSEKRNQQQEHNEDQIISFSEYKKLRNDSDTISGIMKKVERTM